MSVENGAGENGAGVNKMTNIRYGCNNQKLGLRGPLNFEYMTIHLENDTVNGPFILKGN